MRGNRMKKKSGPKQVRGRTAESVSEGGTNRFTSSTLTIDLSLVKQEEAYSFPEAEVSTHIGMRLADFKVNYQFPGAEIRGRSIESVSGGGTNGLTSTLTPDMGLVKQEDCTDSSAEIPSFNENRHFPEPEIRCRSVESDSRGGTNGFANNLTPDMDLIKQEDCNDTSANTPSFNKNCYFPEPEIRGPSVEFVSGGGTNAFTSPLTADLSIVKQEGNYQFPEAEVCNDTSAKLPPFNENYQFAEPEIRSRSVESVSECGPNGFTGPSTPDLSIVKQEENYHFPETDAQTSTTVKLPSFKENDHLPEAKIRGRNVECVSGGDTNAFRSPLTADLSIVKQEDDYHFPETEDCTDTSTTLCSSNRTHHFAEAQVRSSSRESISGSEANAFTSSLTPDLSPEDKEEDDYHSPEAEVYNANENYYFVDEEGNYHLPEAVLCPDTKMMAPPFDGDYQFADAEFYDRIGVEDISAGITNAFTTSFTSELSLVKDEVMEYPEYYQDEATWGSAGSVYDWFDTNMEYETCSDELSQFMTDWDEPDEALANMVVVNEEVVETSSMVEYEWKEPEIENDYGAEELFVVSQKNIKLAKRQPKNKRKRNSGTLPKQSRTRKDCVDTMTTASTARSSRKRKLTDVSYTSSIKTELPRRSSNRIKLKQTEHVDYSQLPPKYHGPLTNSMRYCTYVLAELMSSKYQPINWLIGLSTVKKKLTYNQYANAEEFAMEIRAMCMNPINPSLAEDSLHLLQVFEHLWTYLPKDPEPTISLIGEELKAMDKIDTSLNVQVTPANEQTDAFVVSEGVSKSPELKTANEFREETANEFREETPHKIISEEDHTETQSVVIKHEVDMDEVVEDETEGLTMLSKRESIIEEDEDRSREIETGPLIEHEIDENDYDMDKQSMVTKCEINVQDGDDDHDAGNDPRRPLKYGVLLQLAEDLKLLTDDEMGNIVDIILKYNTLRIPDDDRPDVSIRFLELQPETLREMIAYAESLLGVPSSSANNGSKARKRKLKNVRNRRRSEPAKKRVNVVDIEARKRELMEGIKKLGGTGTIKPIKKQTPYMTQFARVRSAYAYPNTSDSSSMTSLSQQSSSSSDSTMT